MSKTPIPPCPHKTYCGCQALTCNVECYSICAIITLDYISTVLARADYCALDTPDKITFIRGCFGVDVDDIEIAYGPALLANFINTRIDIAYSRLI